MHEEAVIRVETETCTIDLQSFHTLDAVVISFIPKIKNDNEDRRTVYISLFLNNARVCLQPVYTYDEHSFNP